MAGPAIGSLPPVDGRPVSRSFVSRARTEENFFTVISANNRGADVGRGEEGEIGGSHGEARRGSE